METVSEGEKTPWSMVCLLVGAGVLSAFQVGKVPPVLQTIRTDLGLSFVAAGWILSIFNIIGMAMGGMAGAFADAMGHRRVVMAGLVCQAAGALAGASANGLPLLLAARFLEGLGFLSVIVSIPPLVFRVTKPNDLKLAMGLWSCYLPTGACTMMALIPLILTHTDWKGLWLGNSLLLVFYALILYRATPALGTPGKPTKLPDLPRLLTNFKTTVTSLAPFLMALVFTTYTLQWLAVMGFLPTLLLEKYQMSRGTASLLTGLMVFMNVPGNLAGGWLLNRGVRRWKLMALASAVMGVCASMIYSETSLLAVNYAGCLIFSLVGGFMPASVLGGAPIYAPRPSLIATTTGILVQGGQTGQVLGPPVLAWLISLTGSWQVGAWFLGTVAGLGMVLSFGFSRISRD